MTLTLAKPRLLCRDRAVLIVEEALKKFGAPVYVRHEIVPLSAVDGFAAARYLSMSWTPCPMTDR